MGNIGFFLSYKALLPSMLHVHLRPCQNLNIDCLCGFIVLKQFIAYNILLCYLEESFGDL